jgi:bacterioferritin-associated ferredoxin
VTEETIANAVVALGLRSVQEVRLATGAGDGCTCCHAGIRELIEVHTEVAEPVAA